MGFFSRIFGHLARRLFRGSIKSGFPAREIGRLWRPVSGPRKIHFRFCGSNLAGDRFEGSGDSVLKHCDDRQVETE